jgi:leucyl aminopeptidase
METRLLFQPIEAIETEALVALSFEKEQPEDALPEGLALKINALAGNWLDELYRSREFRGKLFDTALLHHPAGLKAKRLLVVGAGKASKFTSAELRAAAGAAIRILKGKSVRDIAFALDPDAGTAENVAAAVEGAILGHYEPDKYKTDKKDYTPVNSFAVVAAKQSESLEGALRKAQIVAEAQNFTRYLVNEPSNRLTPAILADRARAMAEEYGLGCDVLGQNQMRQLGMGALLGVAQGSAEPPTLIVLRYSPPAKVSGDVVLGLIGKGVTFDTGGISIKPAEGMEKMKYDMAGGAAVIGAMRAIAQLKPAIPVTGLIPAVENMPGGKAQRPGDIVTTLSGKTVEVLNTDAEGRLILADAIAYARQLGCTHLVDAATLTGAIVVALGYVNVGVFGNEEDLKARVLAAAKSAGEKMWPMPLDDDYKEQLKSVIADIPNIGSRWGGAITAAMFLKEFVDTVPWVHLDIAGTAWLEEAKPYMAKGPSGMPVRTFVELAASWK